MEGALPAPTSRSPALFLPLRSARLHSPACPDRLSRGGIIFWGPRLWSHPSQPLGPQSALFPASKDSAFSGCLTKMFTPPKEESGRECEDPPLPPWGQPCAVWFPWPSLLGPAVSALGTHAKNKPTASKLAGQASWPPSQRFLHISPCVCCDLGPTIPNSGLF